MGNIIKKSLITVFVTTLLLQTIQPVSAASKLTIREVENEVGMYYEEDINVQPTSEATVEATTETTVEPTIVPTEVPVLEPTVEATSEATSEATGTPESSTEATSEPTPAGTEVLMDIMSLFDEETEIVETVEEGFEYFEALDENATVYVSEEDPNLKKLVIASAPVNYETAEGFEPIDTEIVKASTGKEGLLKATAIKLSSTKNGIKTTYDDTLNPGVIKFERETGGYFSLTPKMDQSGMRVSKISQVIYPMKHNVALKYHVYANEITQEFIFVGPAASSLVEFTLSTGSISPTLQNGNITIYKPSINVPAMEIVKPIVVDNEGKIGTVNVSLSGKQLVVEMDPGFLATAVYPVRLKTTIKTVDNTFATYAHMAQDTAVAYNFANATLSNMSIAELEGNGWKLPVNREYEAYMNIGKSPFKINGTEVGSSYSFYKITDNSFDVYGLRGKYIKSASLGLPIKEMGGDATVYSSTITGSYDITKATYNNANYPLNNVGGVSFVKIKSTDGYAGLDITDYVKGVIEKSQNNNGVMLFMDNENNNYVTFHSSEYYYINKATGAYPAVVVFYYDNPDVASMEVSNFTFNVRPFTKYKYETGLAHFTVMGLDGIAPLDSQVVTKIVDRASGSVVKQKEVSVKDNFFLYPNYPVVELTQNYTQQESNWQLPEYYGNSGADVQDVFVYNKVYDIEVTATKGSVSETKKTWFQLYKVQSFEMLQSIATFYGVSVQTLIQDNNLQDQLVVQDNVLFIREPKQNLGVEYPSVDLSDELKKEIDAALTGRGLQCEFGFEPINLNTGNFLFEAKDASLNVLSEMQEIGRVYNSKNAGYLGAFGYGWSSSFDYHASFNADRSKVTLITPSGRQYLFEDDGSGNYNNAMNAEIGLSRSSDYFTFTTKSETMEFNRNGTLKSSTTKNGNRTNYYYDEFGFLEFIEYANGQQVHLTYNENGLVSELILPDGSVVSYIYDQLNLISFTDQAGQTVSYQYNDTHDMTSWINRNGQTIVTNVYDNEHRVVTQTDGTGAVFNLEYDTNKTIITDGEGSQETITFDEYGQTTSRKNAAGEKKEVKFEKGLLVEETLVNGISYNYTYDGGYLTSSTREDGLTETISYDGNHNIIQINKDQKVTSYTYDGNNNVTSMTDTLGNTTTYVYNSNNQLIQETSPLGSSVYYEYDELGRKVKLSHDNGDFAVYTYNELGFISSETDSLGLTKTYTHSARNELIRTDFSDGTFEVNEFDASGNLIKTIDRNGNSQETTYNIYGKVTQTKDGNGNVTTFEYDKNQNLIKTVKANGSMSINTVDSQGRVIEVSVNGVVQSKSLYNEKGQVVESIDGRGNSTQYEYDDLGNVIQVTEADQSVSTSQYNKLGQLIESVDALGNKTTYKYDELGRRVEQKTDLVTTTTKYNEAGQVVEVKKSTVDTEQVSNKQFNNNGQLVKETDGYGSTKQYVYNQGHLSEVMDELGNSTTYVMDVNGKVSAIQYPDGTSQKSKYDGNGNLIEYIDRNGVKTTFEFDGNNNQTKVSVHFAEGRVASTSYVYNSSNQIIKKTTAEGIVSEYEYDINGLLKQTKTNGIVQSSFVVDSMGQVVEETVNGLVSKYQYDNLGRRVKDIHATGLEKVYHYNTKNQIDQISVNGIAIEKYTYDKYGRVTLFEDQYKLKKEYTYDAAGNITKLYQTNQATVNYSYDEQGSRMMAQQDKLGNQTQFEYDQQGNVTKTTINGNTTSTTYDINQRVATTTDTLGNVTSYRYDGQGQVIETINALGIKSTNVYNEFGQVVKQTNNNILVQKNSYDLDGRLLSKTDAEGNMIQTKYNNFGEVILSVDALGYPTHFTYDENHNLVKVTNALGAVTSWQYNKLNQKISETNAKGNTTSFTYDVYGQLVSTTYPNKTTETNTYNELNQLVSTTDMRGLVTENEYDQSNRIIEIKRNEITQTKSVYDEYNRVVQTMDGYGNSQSSVYDKEGQVIQSIDVAGNVTEYKYDSENRVIEEISEGQVKEITYDAMGQSIKEVINGVRITETSYDGFGNRESQSNNGIVQIRNEYDKNNQIIKTTDALGNTTETIYNKVGQVIKSVDATGAASEIVYDGVGNKIQEKSALGNIKSYGYDEVGNLVHSQNARGYWYTYKYDGMNKMIKESTENTEKTYAYNKVGDLEEIVYENGKKEKFTYDVYGNITSVTQKDKSVLNYTYDDFSKLLSKNDISYEYDKYGNQIKVTSANSWLEMSYDKFMNLVSVNQDGQLIQYIYTAYHEQEKIIYPDGKEVTYSYNDLGQLRQMSAPTGLTSYVYDDNGRMILETQSGGLTVEQDYDSTGNISYKKTSLNGLAISEYSYVYNAEGSVTQEVRTEQGLQTTLSHEYNANDELVKTTQSSDQGTSVIEYVITINGNKAEVKDGKADKSSQYNQSNQLISTNDGKYSYDIRYDDNGNRISERRSDSKLKTYTYDENNQLIEVVDFDHTKVKYTYDGLGNRISQSASKVMTNYGTEENKVTVSYKALIKKIEYLTERNYCEAYFYGDDTEKVTTMVSGTKTREEIEYVNTEWNTTKTTTIEYINDITQQHTQVLTKKQEDTIENIYYGNERVSSDKIVYVTDGYGNVVQDVSQSGGLLESYSYSAYGDRSIEYDPFKRNSEYGYRGEAHTFDQLQYLRARYYHTSNSQFIQEDSYQGELTDPLSRNRYTYVMNNPYKYSDPSGHIAITSREVFYFKGDRLYRRVDTNRACGYGLPYTGTYKLDHRYYVDGEICDWTYRGVRYVNGFKALGVYNNIYYQNGTLGTGLWKDKYYKDGKIGTGWHNSIYYVGGNKAHGTYGGWYYEKGVKQYYVGGNPSNNGSNSGSITGTPTYGDNNKEIPIAGIQTETPSIDTSGMNKKTNDLKAEAGNALGISGQMMEQKLYNIIYGGKNGLDFPQFANVQQLQDRIQEICNYIIAQSGGTGGSQGSSGTDPSIVIPDTSDAGTIPTTGIPYLDAIIAALVLLGMAYETAEVLARNGFKVDMTTSASAITDANGKTYTMEGISNPGEYWKWILASCGILAFNLPSFKKITIDIGHVVDRHTHNGKYPDKDKWPAWMSAAAIEKAIEEAYKNAHKFGDLQTTIQDGEFQVRQFFQGKWGETIVEFWFNYTKNIVESAWPK